MRAIFLVLLLNLGTAQQMVDGIVAIVGENAILQSEVLQTAQLQGYRERGIDITSNANAMNYYMDKALEGLINQNVIVYVAEEDTLVEVTDEEVDAALEQQIQNMLAQAGTQIELEKALGQSLRDFRRDYREEIYPMLLIEKYQQRFFYEVEITRDEVIEFYNAYQDSLPASRSETRYSLIEIPIEPGDDAVNRQLQFMNSLRDSLLNGEDFAKFAARYSEDPGTQFEGGDLGYLQRGTLVQEYEEAAFILDINEISPPIRTPFGYHIIQLLDQQGEKIRTRHILRTIQPTDQDRERVITEIRDIYELLENTSVLFDSLATLYASRFDNRSGIHGWESDLNIPENVSMELHALSPGSYSTPFESQQGSIMLVYLHDHKPSVQPTLENSWQYIQDLALQRKIGMEFDQWINSEKENVFIKIF